MSRSRSFFKPESRARRAGERRRRDSLLPPEKASTHLPAAKAQPTQMPASEHPTPFTHAIDVVKAGAHKAEHAIEVVTHKVVGEAEHVVEIVRQGVGHAAHAIEVATTKVLPRGRLRSTRMEVLRDVKATESPVPPRVTSVSEPSAFSVDEPEPASIRASVIPPPAESAPASSRQIHAPWSLERVERWAGSRWRFVATVLFVTFVGLLVRERASLAKFFSNHFGKKAQAAKLDPVIVTPPAPCPDEMAYVESDGVRVCVDKWEGSLVDVSATGEETPHSPYLTVDGKSVKAVSKPGVVPQGYISHDEAQLACNAAGKRLCEPQEWMAACEGPQKSTYTYGGEMDEAACNIHGRAPLGELFSTSFREHLYDSRVMNDPSLNALEGTVAKTGAFERCTNGYGVHDMNGNLHEWTAEKSGAFRGGYYLEVHKNGEGCRYVTTAHNASYHDYSTGFRCCKAPE